MGTRLVINTGDRFNRLTIVKEVEQHIKPNGQSVRMFKCLCDCGNEKIITLSSLRNGNTKSCGCIHKESFSKYLYKHGLTFRKNRHPLYETWMGMKQRCTNPNRTGYEYYGGDGITVCERWRNSFENFLEDMGERPEGTTLDRYPNQRGNYEPGNCRWATIKEQNNNQRPKRKRGHKTN